jgi:2-amino-4-hydroxy-6-hydroxymethyldihydropteridine diphosphokinase
VEEQPAFLNLAVAAETEYPPRELLAVTQRIEKEVGRQPTYRWGPRAIDIDIIMFGREQVSSPDLTIPHPEMANRAFVLAPLAEIAGDVVHPVRGLTISELLACLEGKQTVKRVGRLHDGSADGPESSK